jgi:hypothetical protein
MKVIPEFPISSPGALFGKCIFDRNDLSFSFNAPDVKKYYDDCCFSPGFALMRLYLGRGVTWVNEANFWMKHIPDPGSIA